MIFLVLSLVAIALFCWNWILFGKLREHRVDLLPHQHGGQGSSPVWQVNVLRPSNYTAAGRKLLPLYIMSALALAAALLAIAVRLMAVM